jgi:nitrite reductase/ring-hydroxylating ferredoxin subunit
MNSDMNQPADKHCPNCSCRPPQINRRRFLAVGSGCVLGALGVAAGTAPSKAATVDIGTLKDFPEDGISEKFTQNDFFVMRHQDKLFAARTVCPHMANALRRDPRDPARVLCDSHGSTFDGEGLVQVGPATSGLVRLGITQDSAGRLLVDPAKEFPQEKWEDRGCFVEIK